MTITERDTPECIKKCESNYLTPYEQDKYYGTEAYQLIGESHIMAEIFDNGPVEAIFSVYSDFITYRSGVYKHISGDFLGGYF